MKRRNAKDGKLGPLGFLCFWLLSFIHYLVPVVIFILFAFCWFRDVPKEEEIGLTEDEAEDLRAIEDDIQKDLLEFKNNEETARARGLRWKNEDGSYDHRSILGRNQTELKNKITSSRGMADDLRSHPLADLNGMILWSSMRVAINWAALGYAIIVLQVYLRKGEILNQNIFGAAILGFGLFLARFIIGVTVMWLATLHKRSVFKQLAGGEQITSEHLVGQRSSKAKKKEEEAAPEQPPETEPPETKKVSASHKHKIWYEILEVSEDASADEIHVAWRSKIKQVHPDRVAGMAPEIQKLAELKAKEINAARDEGLHRFRR